MRTITHWIGGRPYEGTFERVGDVYDPATGRTTSQVAFATSEVVDQAVTSARDAWDTLALVHSPCGG